MVTLRRTVRFSINPPALRDSAAPGRNGYAGKPAMRGLGRYYELDVVCRGEPDGGTGYLINIKAIDDAVRSRVIPEIERACDQTPDIEPVDVLREATPRLAEALHPIVLSAVRWRLSPFTSVEIKMPESAPSRVLLRQRFDFAAAHRLHVADLSTAENRALFGKCNNPSGHGHNYQVEPCVALAPGGAFSQQDLERLTDETLIEPFDHTHLNEDTEAFGGAAGVNPSVENIARVFHERLAPVIERAGADLVSVTVWETDRTSACYPG